MHIDTDIGGSDTLSEKMKVYGAHNTNLTCANTTGIVICPMACKVTGSWEWEPEKTAGPEQADTSTKWVSTHALYGTDGEIKGVYHYVPSTHGCTGFC